MRHDLRSQLATLLLIGSGAIGFVSIASAQAPMPEPFPAHAPCMFGMPPHPGLGPMPMPMLRGLALSDAQEDQIFKIFHEQAPAVRERMRTIRRTREQMAELMRAQSLDRPRASDLAEAQARAMADLTLMRLEAMRAVREVLTPEQRSRLDRVVKDRPPGPPR